MEIFIGVFSGIITGTGMGGGTVLIFLLTTLTMVSQYTAQASNIVFFIPTAIISTIINLKQKNIDIKLVILISVFGTCGVFLGNMILQYVKTEFSEKIFGIFLICILFNEIYSLNNMYKLEKKRNNKYINKK